MLSTPIRENGLGVEFRKTVMKLILNFSLHPSYKSSKFICVVYIESHYCDATSRFAMSERILPTNIHFFFLCYKLLAFKNVSTTNVLMSKIGGDGEIRAIDILKIKTADKIPVHVFCRRTAYGNFIINRIREQRCPFVRRKKTVFFFIKTHIV